MAPLYARWVPPKPSTINRSGADNPKGLREVHKDGELESPRKPSKKHSRKHVLETPAEQPSQSTDDHRNQNSKDEHIVHDGRSEWSRSKSKSKTVDTPKPSKKRKRAAEDSAELASQLKGSENPETILTLPVAELDGLAEKQRHKSRESKGFERRDREGERDVELAVRNEDLERSGSPQTILADEFVKKTEDKKSHRSKRPKKRDRQGKDTLEFTSASWIHETPEDDEGSYVANVEELDGSAKHKKVLTKFQKSVERQDGERVLEEASTVESSRNRDNGELHGLEPLPQPDPVAEPEFKPTFSALPSWISNPITVPHSARTPFADMPLDQKTVELLSQRGYTEAFAIQSAVIPLLLGSRQIRQSDLCVAATTGSGKTLAYVLPMIEALKSRPTTKLRGLVIVPTRELVAQVSKVAEQYISGTHLRTGTAVGAVPLSNEQETLIEKGRQFDPEEYESLQDKAQRRLLEGDVDVKEDVRLLEDAVRMLPNHVPVYSSSIDILICTPGRLIDHIQSTVGFSLDDLEWLVIDEADRLLDENFQQWVEIVMTTLENSRPSTRDRLLTELWLRPERRKIQKIILSATMTKDISKLSSLRLWRPKFVAVEGAETFNVSDGPGRISGGQGCELPTTLGEYAVPVGDGLEKPLYFLRLLQSDIFGAQKRMEGIEDFSDQREEHASMGSSDDDDLSSLGPTTSESSASAEERYTEPTDMLPIPTGDAGFDSPKADSLSQKSKHVRQLQAHTDDTHCGTAANVLIFTNSNENAARLSHLLGILHPPYAGLTGVLTKSSASSASKAVLAAFRKGKKSILIASDRASRGLDLSQLSHVINYDMPRSLTSYIHRVGRTARAGRQGTAWTLYTSTEARWFWNTIARATDVSRPHPVERKRFDAVAISAEPKQEYEEALKALERAVHGSEG